MTPKGNKKFKTLLVQIFSLKTKNNQILPVTIEKIDFFLSKKTVYGSIRLGITMGECKTKAIQTNLGIFRHNQTYPGIILAYSGTCRTLCYPDIFKTVVCPEP